MPQTQHRALTGELEPPTHAAWSVECWLLEQVVSACAQGGPSSPAAPHQSATSLYSLPGALDPLDPLAQDLLQVPW